MKSQLIRFRTEQGMMRRLTPAQFQRQFGARYCATLLSPKKLPAAFLSQCLGFDADAKYALSDRTLRGYRRKIAEGYIAPVYIAEINESVGYGLFAMRDIKPGEMIGEYAGSLTEDWTPTKKKDGDANPYLFIYPFKTTFGIDATKHGNVLRFVNHSLEKNNVQHLYICQNGLVHAVYVAKKRIPKDCQILLNYGKYYKNVFPAELNGRWEKRSPFR